MLGFLRLRRGRLGRRRLWRVRWLWFLGGKEGRGASGLAHGHVDCAEAGWEGSIACALHSGLQ